MRCVLAEDDAGPRGYALFTSEGQWEEGTFLPDGVLDVHEAITVDPAAAAALWGDLLSRDLITTFRLHMRPVDDPLLHLLADSRQGLAAGSATACGSGWWTSAGRWHSAATRARWTWSSRSPTRCARRTRAGGG